MTIVLLLPAAPRMALVGYRERVDGRHRRRQREEREVGEVEAAKLQAEDRHIVDILAF